MKKLLLTLLVSLAVGQANIFATHDEQQEIESSDQEQWDQEQLNQYVQNWVDHQLNENPERVAQMGEIQELEIESEKLMTKNKALKRRNEAATRKYKAVKRRNEAATRKNKALKRQRKIIEKRRV